MANRIVSLTAQLGLDGRGFQRGMRDAERTTARLGQTLAHQLGGAFGAAMAGQVIRHIGQVVGRIKDLSEQFSVTTDEVQLLDEAARQSGQSVESIGVALEKVGVARKDAAEGNEELRAMFSKFGVSLADLNNPALRNIDLMKQMSVAIRSMNLTAADSQALRDLFGKSGARLAAVFKDLENVKFVPISEQDIKNIDEATKKLEKLKREFTAVGAKAVSGVVGSDDESNGKRGLRLALAAMSPELISSFLIKEFGQRLFPTKATASNPSAPSSEMVGPSLNDASGPMFEDKAAEKKRLEILKQEQQIAEKLFQLSLDSADVATKRAMLEEKIKFHLKGAADAAEFGEEGLANAERLKALDAQGELQNLKATPNRAGHTASLTGFQSAGAFSGLTSDRAFALRAMTEDTKATARNTAATAEGVRAIREVVQRGPGPRRSFF